MPNVRDDDKLCAYSTVAFLRSLHYTAVWLFGLCACGFVDSAVVVADAAARALDESDDCARLERGDVFVGGTVSRCLGLQDLGHEISIQQVPALK